ncbi:hypothetical protein [Variovorax sp. YR566]|uniref:hypothetical protein n=1 Tax=Variovorax sp. YR566 TaxID=3450237 RepID=UPI003F7F8982
MTLVAYVPAPAGAPPNTTYFRCTRLAAELSTASCAAQWKAASTKIGTACHSCPVGQCHALPQGGAVNTSARRDKPRICLRCGRDDLRIVQERGICVSCANRQYEVIRGRNAKGKVPTKEMTLDAFVVATEAPNGAIAYRSVEARHLAEAVGVMAHVRLRQLPDGTQLTEARPGPSMWSEGERRFVVGCPACGHAGLLERKKGNTLHHHCPACNGTPNGPGWALAKTGIWTMLIDVGGLKAWLEASKEDFPHDRWSFTGFGCTHCKSAVLQARSAVLGVTVRCPACREQAE